jgi:TldD protein
VRTVGKGIVLGLGVRVLKGDSTGYAYTEQLSEARMREAGAHRRADRLGWRGAGPGAIRPVDAAGLLQDRAFVARDAGRDKVELLRRADKAARGFERASSGSRPRCPRSGARCWW